MDENNNNDINNKPQKENPFKNKAFYVAYAVTIIILILISLIFSGMGSDTSAFLIIIFLLCIPYGIIGLVVWIIVRINDKIVALGILLGSITPFVVVFCATGGCGLRWL